MISATTSLISSLLGSTLTAWLSCEPVQVVVGLGCFGYVVGLVVRLIKN